MQTEFETYGIYRDRSKYINREVAIFFKLQSLCSRPMPLKITVISYQNGGKVYYFSLFIYTYVESYGYSTCFTYSTSLAPSKLKSFGQASSIKIY